MQRILDRFYYARKYVTAFLTFLSIRLYGSEVSFLSVLDQKLPSRCKRILLEGAEAPDVVFDLARERYKGALDRRNIVSEKLKALLTLGSLMLAAIGLLVPRGAFGASWSRIGLYVCALLLLNAIALILASQEVRTEMHVTLDETDVPKRSNELKAQVAGDYLMCAHDVDQGTDYLVEIYKAAKMSLSSGMWIAAALVSIVYTSQPKSDPVGDIVSRLRGDPALVELLRGPRGMKGESASEEEVIGRLVKDHRLKEVIMEVMTDSAVESLSATPAER